MDLAGRGDRYGDIDESRAEGFGAADAGGHLAIEGCGDLLSRREVPRRSVGVVRVGDGVAVAVDDHGSAADGVAVLEDDRDGVVSGALFEEILNPGRDDPSVSLDGRQEPALLARLERDSERDLQHGQHRRGDEQVGDEQTAGHGSTRKPTPRTAVTVRVSPSFFRIEARWTSMVFEGPYQ